MTTANMVNVTMERLGDDPAADTMFYTYGEVLAALNAIQRLFVLLTLCLERTATFALATDGTSSYELMNTFADWLVPLRIRVVGGAKVRPSTLADLAALDNSWRVSSGVPSRYAVTGFGLLSIYKQPTVATSLDITFARCPALMTATVDPEIPEQYHPNLIDGAIPFLRIKEGAQEWQKTLDLWTRFIDAAKDLAGQVKSRNIELGYDVLPSEVARFDMSPYLKRGPK